MSVAQGILGERMPALRTEAPGTSGDVARLLALDAALVSGVVAAWLARVPGIPWLGLGVVAAAALLLLVPLLAGLSGRVILVISAVVAGLTILPIAIIGVSQPDSTNAIVVAGVSGAIGVIPVLILLSLPRLLGRVETGLGALILSVCAALAVAAWLGLMTAGVWLLADSDNLIVLVLAVVPFQFALWLNRLEAKQGLRRAARLAAWRDGLLRWTGLIAAAGAALKIAAHATLAAHSAFFGSALEGLVGSAGILAGSLALALLGSLVWLLPAIALRRQLAGRVTPSGVGESLWFATFACVAAVAVEAMVMEKSAGWGTDSGAACLIALATLSGFAWVRLGLSLPARKQAWPLWILLPDARDAAMRRYAARLAAAWQDGPVTVLASPEAALALAGVHLRLSAKFRALDWLFPRNRIQLADWDETLPGEDRWAALPVRELYAAPDLWPAILAARLGERTLCVIVTDGESAALDRLRTVLPPGRTVIHQLASPNDIARDGDRAELHGFPVFRLKRWSAADAEHWVTGQRKHRERGSVGMRRMLIGYPSSDAEFGRALAQHMNGQRDVSGRYVQARGLAIAPERVAQAWSLRVPVMFWQFQIVMAARAFPIADRGTLERRLGTFFLALLAQRWSGEHDMVLVEPGRSFGFDFATSENVFTVAARHGHVDRLIAVLPAQRGPHFELALPAARYAGAVRRLATTSIDADAQQVARRLLALDFDSAIPGTLSAGPERYPPPAEKAAVAEMPAPSNMLKVFLSSTLDDLKEYREEIVSALNGLSNVEVRGSATPTLNVSLLTADVEQCDVFVGIYAWRHGHRPPGSMLSLIELEYRAAMAAKRTCLIFLADSDADWPHDKMDAFGGDTDGANRIAAWREELQRQHVVAFFNTPVDLATKLVNALAQVGAHARTAASMGDTFFSNRRNDSETARIYISSTYEDMKAFRETAYRVLRQLGHDVVAIEDYVAADARPLQKCLADVASCDAYVGIIGFRYGYVPTEDNPEGKSITELEYRAAERQGKPRLVFIYKGLADPNSADVFTGQGDSGRLVRAFKEELQSQRLVSEFTTADELGQKVAVAVGNALRAAPTVAGPVSDEDWGLEMLRRSARDILKLYLAMTLHQTLYEIWLFKMRRLPTDDPAQIDGRLLSDVAAYCAPRMTSIADAVSACDRYLNESNRNSIEGHREELERAIGLLRNAASSTVDAERSAAVGKFNERLATWLSELDDALKELADRLDGDEMLMSTRRLKEAYPMQLEPVERYLQMMMDDVNPVLKKCKALIEEHHGLQDVHDKFPGLFDWLTKRDVGVAASEWRRLKRRLNSAREAWKQFGALPSGGENWEADVRDDGEETWKLAETCISNIDTMLLPEASADTISLVVPPLSKLQARVEKHFKIVDEALREGFRPIKVRVGEAIMQIE